MAVGILNQSLVFEFPEIHEDASLTVSFQRTLRIPDDDRDYPLPPGLGRFPMKAIDELRQEAVPAHWPKRGGVVLPMWQAEAMWIRFASPHRYPFAVKVAAGKINAVSGEPWSEALTFGRAEQDFVEIPHQPWLDGFNVGKGIIRQFIAMPLGQGYTVEEQVTGRAEFGGVQIIAYPLKGEVWAEREALRASQGLHRRSGGLFRRVSNSQSPASIEMGLASGGRMKQVIHRSTEASENWAENRSRVFVAIANSLAWRAMTGEPPPTIPPTAKQYQEAGLPWFAYYSKGEALSGSPILRRARSVVRLAKTMKQWVVPENEGFDPADATVIDISGDRAGLPRSGARSLGKPGP